MGGPHNLKLAGAYKLPSRTLSSGLAAIGSGVESVLDSAEVNATRLEIGQQFCQVRQAPSRSSRAYSKPACHPSRRRQRPSEHGTIIAGAARLSTKMLSLLTPSCLAASVCKLGFWSRVDTRASKTGDLIIERTRAGLAAARKRGKRLGPPVKWQADMARKAQVLLDKGDLNAEEVARTLKVSRRTLFRGLKAARDHDELLGSLAHVKSAALSGRLTR